MIRNLYRLFPKASLMARLGMLTATRAILEGILLSFLVPILAALLRPEPDLLAAQPWLVIGAIGLAFHGILTIVATPIGFAASSELAAELRQRIMRHVTTLPLGWFTDANKARLARAVTADVGTIAHLAVTIGSPAITATVLPTTIAIVTFVVDWRMALLFASIGLIAFLALRRAARIAAEAEIELERTTTEIANRAIEFGQAQPVLRAAGRATTGTERMQEALAAHRTTYRRGLARSRLPDLTFTSVVMMGFVLALTIGTNLLLSG
ncbi:MAG: ABC transporter transmembrane domain-containing protein, partial [Rhizobiaceae bacterium]